MDLKRKKQKTHPALSNPIRIAGFPLSCDQTLNLNKIDKYFSFYNQQINKGTPHFVFMCQAQNADTPPLKQHQLSQNSVPYCPLPDMHLEPESEKWVKNIDFLTVKNVPKQENRFCYF